MSGPLEGLVVVDASTIIAGPLAAEILAEYGATVIKVEHPDVGDGSRRIGYTNHAVGVWWKVLSQNKQCVTCRLSTPDGAQPFRELVGEADVLIENFRPGTMERWGLDYETLSAGNPGLVMLRVSGFGQDGPYSSRPGYGTLAEAMSGFAHMTGFPDGPPTLPAVPLADGVTGVMGAAACMMALWARDAASGSGQVIDMSLYGSLIYIFGMLVPEYKVSGVLPTRRGNRLGNAPRNAWICADGKWVAYSAQTSKMAEAILRFVGREDEERFKEPFAVMRYGDELDELLGEWIGQHDRHEVLEQLVKAGIPVGPIYDIDDLLSDDHVRFRGDYAAVDDDEFGPLPMAVGPARFGRYERRALRRAGGSIGEHNKEIYRDWLGVSEERMQLLRERGVI